jgi:hypothetical protein
MLILSIFLKESCLMRINSINISSRELNNRHKIDILAKHTLNSVSLAL